MVRQQGESEQVPGPGRAHYALKQPHDSPSHICGTCGADIVLIGGRWYATEADWPNLAHCYYGGIGSGRGHFPED